MNLLYSFIFSLLILGCTEKKTKETTIKTETINQSKTTEKSINIEESELSNQIYSIEYIALDFINSYVKNCNKMNKSIGITEWVNSNPNSSESLKFELNKIMHKAEKEDPEYGLGFDPIFDSQDFPDKGFKLVSSDSENGIVIVKDMMSDGFERQIKLVKKKNKWLVNGIGIINNKDFNQSEKQNNTVKFEDYKSVKKYIINGEYIGDLYVKYVNDTIFNSLKIINKSDTIYKINNLDFSNEKGQDFIIPKNSSNFYGYTFALISEKSFVLNYYSNEGKNIGDNLTIIWNEENKVFEVMIAP